MADLTRASDLSFDFLSLARYCSFCTQKGPPKNNHYMEAFKTISLLKQ
jgi:hypothetical protein